MKAVLVLLIFTISVFAQQKPRKLNSGEEVYGLILNGNGSVLYTNQYVYRGSEKEISLLYFQKIYSDTTISEEVLPYYNGRQTGYFNPVLLLPIDVFDYYEKFRQGSKFPRSGVRQKKNPESK